MAYLLVKGILVNKLVENLSIILEQKKMMLCTAESCTGGMIAAAMTERAGSSSVFTCGFVTYSNISKTDLLGVDKLILETHGAVSKQCAHAMSQGALKRSNADIAISVTGIAGPSGGSAEKPVGLVYINIASHTHNTTFECHFKGDRSDIRTQTTHFALEKSAQFLTEVQQ